MKTGWGIGKREVEREREERIKRVGNRSQERSGISVGQEKSQLEMTPEYLINRTSKTSIKRDINIWGG